MERNIYRQMDNLKFSNSSFVLYSILPDFKKIDYIYRGLKVSNIKSTLDEQSENNDNLVNMNDIASEIYKEHFSEIISPVDDTQIGIISYMTKSDDVVNIFFYNGYIHVNSNKLKPIHEFINMVMLQGNIVTLDKSKKKTPENKDRFHLRYYRAYRKINSLDLYPIILN